MRSGAFTLFHWTLGLVVLVDSTRTAARASAIAGNPHVALLASVEAFAAVLFLWPRTLRRGAFLLVAVFAVAFGAHALRGELAGPLLVYAAGAALVGVHGTPSRGTETL